MTGLGLYPRKWLAACVLLVAQTAAQTIVATNWTSVDTQDNGTVLYSIHSNGQPDAIATLLPLTPAARVLPSEGLSGQIYHADPSNQIGITSDSIAFISCDASEYPGNIDQTAVFFAAVNKNVTAVLFYTTQADYCQLKGWQYAYAWIFSMKNKTDTDALLGEMATWNSNMPQVAIAGPNFGQDSHGNTYSTGTSSTSQSQQDGNPRGGNPSTTVAMIILYSVTGIITALFLTIIMTGAIRAHRHPERYGPRAVVGMPRQSRARGLGRAILDTIPIVKVGQREPPKPTDVELGARTVDLENAHEPEQGVDGRTATVGQTEGATKDLTTINQTAPTDEGIEAATTADITPLAEGERVQGCSICTEDFEPGQDQRVLPCDHRYHPDCIDPWLLNVSSTCPLCRIDLRPQPAPELDEHGNPVVRESDDGLEELPPPIETQGDRRSSVRRSLMLGVLGIGRPERLSREERVLALRRYRLQQAARRRREAAAAAAAAAAAPADASTGADTAAESTPAATDPVANRAPRRLRDLLRIRTRRIGRDGQDQDLEQDRSESVEAGNEPNNQAGDARPS